MAESGTFAAFYASALQHPLLLWLAAGLALLPILARRGLDPALRRFCLLLVGLSLLDAWLTSSRVYGLGALPGWAASAVPLFFVLAGDFRFLLLVMAATPDGRFRPDARSLRAAAGLTLIVPLATQLALAVLPEPRDPPRTMFLIYELGFVALTLGLLRWHPKLRAAPWLGSVSRFVILYYALWAGADAILLTTGSDLGFLLRVVPNVLYYGGLIAVVALLAPTREAASPAA